MGRRRGRRLPPRRHPGRPTLLGGQFRRIRRVQRAGDATTAGRMRVLRRPPPGSRLLLQRVRGRDGQRAPARGVPHGSAVAVRGDQARGRTSRSRLRARSGKPHQRGRTALLHGVRPAPAAGHGHRPDAARGPHGTAAAALRGRPPAPGLHLRCGRRRGHRCRGDRGGDRGSGQRRRRGQRFRARRAQPHRRDHRRRGSGARRHASARRCAGDRSGSHEGA